MNWMTILWPMVTATCLTLALMHFRIGCGKGQRASHLFFSLAALAAAVISVLELTVLCTNDLARCNAVLRWASVPIGIMVSSVVAFVWAFFGTGRKWLGLAEVMLIWLAELANLVSPVPVVRHAVALHRVETYGGAWFTVPTIVGGPWTIVEIVSVALAVAYVSDVSGRERPVRGL